MTPNQIDLSIIIPAFMEADRIADVLIELAAFLGTRDYGEVEVLVVTADSPDGTAAIAAAQAKRFRHFRVIHAGPRVGKGRDVRLGMFEATGRYRLFMDADLATPLIHLDDAYKLIKRGASVIIAVRNLLVIHDGLPRKIMSKAANLAAQLLVIPGVNDTQCGFKGFEASAAEAIFGRMTMLQWSFDMEVLGIARQLHYQIESFEISDWSDPKAKASGLVGDSLLKVALGGFLDPFKIRLNIWTGRYREAHYFHKPRY